MRYQFLAVLGIALIGGFGMGRLADVLLPVLEEGRAATRGELDQIKNAILALEGAAEQVEDLPRFGRVYFDRLGMHIRAGTSDTRRPEIQFIAGGKDAGQTARFAGYSITNNQAGPYMISNGFFDGTNWNIDDTALDGAIYSQSDPIAHQWRYLPNGSNPRTPVILLELYNDGTGFIWNDAGNDHDFRFEGANNANLLKGDGGTDTVSVDGFFQLDGRSELTIAAGVVTATRSWHTIDTEADAGTDDLDTINGGVIGNLLVIQSADDARDTTAKDATGNLALAGDFTFTGVSDRLMLQFDGVNWIELSRSDNG